MTRIARRIAEWWFAPAPAERLAMLRILIGGGMLVWLVARLPEIYAVARLPADHFEPVGVVRVLGAPLPPALAFGIASATAVLLVAFVLGFRFRSLAPVAAAGVLWSLSYRNSWGMVFHTENLMVLHVIALAFTPAADAWAIDRTRAAPPAAGYGWAIKLLVALLAATYLLAGIAKLRIAGMAWLDGEQLRNQIAVDNLRKALLGGSIAPLAIPFLDHPSWFVGFSVMTIALELGAPIALVSMRAGRWWGLAAWGFHLGVVLLMNIVFPYPLFGLAYVPLLRVERAGHWVIGRWRRRAGMPGS